MNYEKKYKEALERARQFSEKPYLEDSKGIVDYIFPELKESEDDSIRKAIHIYLDWLDGRKDYAPKGEYSIRDMIAWLENQSKQKTTDKVEPKFKVGDEIKTANEEPLTITKIDEKGYWSEDLFICDFDEECIWDLVEQPAWSEEDEKMFNSALWHIKNSCGNQGKNSGEFEVYNWLKTIKYRYLPQPKQEWSEEDEYHKR